MGGVGERATYRASGTPQARLPRRAAWHRRVAWWFNDGPERLRVARARREAVYGDPHDAACMLLGKRAMRSLLMEMLFAMPDPAARRVFYRDAVMAMVAPGGRVNDSLTTQAILHRRPPR